MVLWDSPLLINLMYQCLFPAEAQLVYRLHPRKPGSPLKEVTQHHSSTILLNLSLIESNMPRISLSTV